VLDYDQKDFADALRCLSLADGKEIWRFTYPVKVKRNHGMSRTTPTLAGNYVVSMGPKCHVVCLDATTGQFVWGIDLVKEYNAEVPEWYAGQCPLVDGDRVILAPGGDALMIAVELATGKVVWKTPNPHDWKMTHSSILPIEFAGKRQYVYCGSRGVAGVDANAGAILWETDKWAISIATVPTPVDIGGGKLFFSGGYNAGAKMFQLTEADGKIVPAELFALPATTFGATQQTPILYQGHIYGVRPDGQLACLALSGKVVWTSGSKDKFGLGPFLIAGGSIFVMNDDGLLTLAEAGPAGYRALVKNRVLNGHDSWAPMALAGGRLLLRDLTRMVCLDITGAKP
jgi:outer membrane protein assembly factor BamB